MKKNRFIAHTENENGELHYLEDHLRSTAEMASRFAGEFGCQKMGRILGLLHDIGKYNPGFQKYIRNEDIKKGPNHSGVGAIEAVMKGLPFSPFPLAGHHSGLTSAALLKSRLKKDPDEMDAYEASIGIARQAVPEISLIPVVNKLLPSHFSALLKDPDSKPRSDFLIRMLFSSLVDADFLDTESHMSSGKSDLRKASQKVDLDNLFNKFQEDQNALMQGKDSDVNRIRCEIYEHCLAAAEENPGIFRLSVPTGGGKTRSSLGFALKHALKFNKRRIVYSIPFTSIIEQTSSVFRDILGEDNVLEHHSGVIFDETDENSYRFRLASENWDFPLIVTTNVQLFESLFANRTSRCRKLHNLANSVIILDEVQTLPVKLMEPTLDVLQTLVDDYGLTVVLCTATQPAIDLSTGFKGLKNVRDIIPEPGGYFEKLKRVEYETPFKTEKWGWERVAEEMVSNNQALCVVNVKKDAVELLSLLKDRGSADSVFHLSSSMCPCHRRVVLKQVRQRLSEGLPCYLVSTQVVEAGVDIDFPLVLRSLGPLDRIVQAAGRCNREGRLTSGRVVVFETEEASTPPGEYRAGFMEAKSLFKEEVDLHDPETFLRYFKRLYTTIGLDGPGVQESRRNLDFITTAHKYRLIKDDTVSVVVRYGLCKDEVDALIGDLQKPGPLKRGMIRKLQPYMVNVFRHKLPGYQADGMIKEIIPGLYEWLGDYDEMMGLREAAHNPSSLIV